MTIFSEFVPHRSRLPALNAQSFAFQQLVCIHSTTLDLRWAMVELALRSLTAMWSLAHRQLVLLIRRNHHHGKKCCGAA
jgi:hypothetical protein